jgi:hypothetical protein
VDHRRGPVPIGKPIANTQTYVLDNLMQPLPVGAPGELHIGGDGVTCGYLNRPELTAEKFVRDPFSKDPEARLYKTGDLARWLPSGELECLGRTDQQVKVRGFRIEPGEIEAVLAQHQNISASAVVARDDLPGGRALVAYIVPRTSPAPGVNELRSFLQGRLPDYMVPSVFVPLDALPLTPNNKVDRRALPAPDVRAAEADRSFVPPRTPAEELVAGVWEAVLNRERIGSNDNFFHLGGHSLLATQVASRLRVAFGKEVPLRMLFDSPTVSSLALVIEALGVEGGEAAGKPLTKVPRDGELPLSFSQQRLWFLDQYEPGSPVYNMPSALRLRGGLNVEAMQHALSALVRRHESLRTSFPAKEGQPFQAIAPPGPVPLPIEDLSGLPEQEREQTARRRASAEARRPFNLATGPVLRASLLRLGEQDHVLLLNIHHIVSDGWSQGVVLRELTTLYSAFATGQPSPLPELPIQYADFAAWQRNWLQGDRLQEQLDYWKQRLADLAPLELPTDRPRPPTQSFRGGKVNFEIPPKLTGELRKLGRSEGATMFMTLLAAFQALLSRYSGQMDVAVGTPIAGRHRKEVENLIGFFVNTLVLRTDLGGNPSFRDLLRRVREVSLGAYAHQDLPFEKIVDELQIPRDPSRNPLFQVMFALQNTPPPRGSGGPAERSPPGPASERAAPRRGGGPGTPHREQRPHSGRAAESVERAAPGGPQFHGLTMERLLGAGTETVKFDIALQAFEVGQRLKMILTYSTDLFDHATMERLTQHFKTILEGIVADPGQPVATLSLLTESERVQLLESEAAKILEEDPEQVLARLGELSEEEVNALLSKGLESGEVSASAAATDESEVFAQGEVGAAGTAGEDVENLLANLDGLSDEEINALLNKELAGSEK